MNRIHSSLSNDNQTSLLVTSIMCWGPEPGPSPDQCSLRKQLTWHFATPPLISWQTDVRETTAEIPYSDDASLLGSTSDWFKQIFLVPQPITHISQIWVVKCHQNGISAVLLRHHFEGKLVAVTWNVSCFLSLRSTATTWTTKLKRWCFLEARQDRNLNKQ